MTQPFLLRNLSPFLKKIIFLYFLLTSLGFGVAALMSYDKYHYDHQKTRNYYLGDPAEGEEAFKKPYAQLIGVTHVHSYTMPLVFLMAWLALSGVAQSDKTKLFLVMGGALAIVTYCAAPYALRYGPEKSVYLFTVGGIGLFTFYFIPVLLVFSELVKPSKS